MLPTEQVNDLTNLKDFANKNNFLECFRTSAKTGYNIDESMKFLIENILERMNSINTNNFNVDRNSAVLDPSKHQNIDSFRIEKERGCC